MTNAQVCDCNFWHQASEHLHAEVSRLQKENERLRAGLTRSREALVAANRYISEKDGVESEDYFDKAILAADEALGKFDSLLAELEAVEEPHD